jgi:glycerophosphoryl diester phosphodiesterase
MRLDPWPFPRWIAHRGAGKLAPENTLAAFRLGAAHGYRAFECDVKLSADGVPFLLHDATLDRTTDARGTAGDRPWAELSRLDAGTWHSRGFAGEPLPSLEAIVAFCQASGHALNIEIKPTPGVEADTGRAVALACSRLREPSAPRPWTAPLLFTSFRPEALLAAMQAAPGIPRGLLLDTLWPGWEAVAEQLGAVAVVTNYNAMTPDLVRTLHAAGRRALCYTVNDPSVAQWLLAAGVDGSITDAVDRFPPGG